ncbi:putative cyclase-domain-containing protein [Xylogone sp. PMI_703]|nr:putative cyclase-domain-containing protein [Xylogone sp. PMI_703]
MDNNDSSTAAPQPSTPEEFPSFEDLPLDPSHPPYSAWYIWGKDDQLGCLNHLTNERVVAAARQIRTGVSVGLNWELHQMSVPPFYRTKLIHEIFPIEKDVNDDRVQFNTQTSSQWDSFRHWSYPDGRFYNGVTQGEVRGGSSTRNGIHEWAKKGIVGRGILIDFYSYALEESIPYEPWSYHKIPVSTIKAIAERQNIEFQPGDILFLRTGFVKRYNSMSEAELTQVMTKSEYHYPGLEGSITSLKWLWESRFAAIAGDNPGFEAWNAGLGNSQDQECIRMHEYILSGFGLPIGELFDLESLSEQCKLHNRWTFFVTSEPLNLVGGVGSPPNAIAVF